MIVQSIIGNVNGRTVNDPEHHTNRVPCEEFEKLLVKPSKEIDQLITGLDDWRGEMLASIRKTILEADPEIVEEWKWMGSPCWSRDGLICVGNAHKDKVKLTFSQGASIADPDKLFNNGLNGKLWRAIDIYEGDKINKRSLKLLIRSAVAYNQAKLKTTKKPDGTRVTAKKKPTTR